MTVAPTVRGISLWQPWASAYVDPELKDFETRHWSTNYRGPLLIHSTKTLNDIAKFAHMESEAMQNAFPKLTDLPLGKIVGIVHLQACFNDVRFQDFLNDSYEDRYTSNHKSRWEIEQQFGDFSTGRFFWYAPVKLKFAEPIEMKGSQGFWNYRTALLPGEAIEFIKNIA